MAGSVLHVYADDILLYHTINSTSDFLSLQSDINKITAWSCANFLTLNSNKCKFMVLSRRRSPSYPVIPLTLGDHPLEQVMSFKYLGVHLSCLYYFINWAMQNVLWVWGQIVVTEPAITWLFVNLFVGLTCIIIPSSLILFPSGISLIDLVFLLHLLRLLREVLGYCMHRNLFYYFCVYFVLLTYYLSLLICNCWKLVFQGVFVVVVVFFGDMPQY